MGHLVVPGPLLNEAAWCFLLQSFSHTSPLQELFNSRQLPASCAPLPMLCVVFCAGNDGGWKADCRAPGSTGPCGCVCPAHDPAGRVRYHRRPVSSHAAMMPAGHGLRCCGALLHKIGLQVRSQAAAFTAVASTTLAAGVQLYICACRSARQWTTASASQNRLVDKPAACLSYIPILC